MSLSFPFGDFRYRLREARFTYPLHVGKQCGFRGTCYDFNATTVMT